MKNFVNDCATGLASYVDLEDYVDRWHEISTGEPLLSNFLGFTPEEYDLFVINNNKEKFEEFIEQKRKELEINVETIFIKNDYGIESINIISNKENEKQNQFEAFFEYDPNKSVIEGLLSFILHSKRKIMREAYLTKDISNVIVVLLPLKYKRILHDYLVKNYYNENVNQPIQTITSNIFDVSTQLYGLNIQFTSPTMDCYVFYKDYSLSILKENEYKDKIHFKYPLI